MAKPGGTGRPTRFLTSPRLAFFPPTNSAFSKVKLIERNGQRGLLNLPALVQYPFHLGDNAPEGVDQALVAMVSQAVEGVHQGGGLLRKLADAGPDILEVEDEIARQLLLHVGHEGQNHIVGRQ